MNGCLSTGGNTTSLAAGGRVRRARPFLSLHRAVALLCGLGAAPAPRAQAWPAVQAAGTTQRFPRVGRAQADTPLRLFLRDKSGSARYRLECHNGNWEGMEGISYSGDFHCALFAIRDGLAVSGNLLATSDRAEQESDWLNRGRMLARELYGACGRAPGYGARRRFRLRGLQVTLEFLDLSWGRDRVAGAAVPPLDGFTVRVRVRPDTSARTPSAEPAARPTGAESCQFPPGGSN